MVTTRNSKHSPCKSFDAFPVRPVDYGRRSQSVKGEKNQTETLPYSLATARNRLIRCNMKGDYASAKDQGVALSNSPLGLGGCGGASGIPRRLPPCAGTSPPRATRRQRFAYHS
ncbi:hypothetical protein SBA2_230003 [Acidobacteriia bacterium SbA2]|nr:hypothetical protein SBA2_230003 [Acidobacteriia bacterium SbA2]